MKTFDYLIGLRKQFIERQSQLGNCILVLTYAIQTLCPHQETRVENIALGGWWGDYDEVTSCAICGKELQRK